MATLVGRYQALVKNVSLGVVGSKGAIALKVAFEAYSELVGDQFKDIPHQYTDKLYFLSDTIVKSGPSAGKTVAEMTRDIIKDVYGYSGDLDEDAIKAVLVGQKVEIVCQEGMNGFTDVKYVNKEGSSNSKGLKRLAKVPEKELSTLAALWGGKTQQKAVNPSELFNSMVKDKA